MNFLKTPILICNEFLLSAKISEQEPYTRLQLDTSRNATILYVHSGGYMLVSYDAASAETLIMVYSLDR